MLINNQNDLTNQKKKNLRKKKLMNGKEIFMYEPNEIMHYVLIFFPFTS